jgi:hypothetical protein
MVPCHCPEARNCDRRPMRWSGRSVGAAGQSKKPTAPAAQLKSWPLRVNSARHAGHAPLRLQAPLKKRLDGLEPLQSRFAGRRVLAQSQWPRSDRGCPFRCGTRSRPANLKWSAGPLLDSHRMPHLRGHLLHGVGELALGKLLVGEIEYHQNDGSGSQCLHERPPESGWRIEASRRVRIGTPAARDAGGGGPSRKMPGARRGRRKRGRPLEVASCFPILPLRLRYSTVPSFVYFLMHTSRFGGVAH